MTMPQYLFRADRGSIQPHDRFDAVNDAAAIEESREMLIDEGAEEGEGGSLYRLDDGGRGDEEFVAEVRLGDDCDE
jgi:hypothetical protein